VPDEASVPGAERAAAGPKDRDPEALLRFIERFTSVLVAVGFPPMPARVFTALLVTDSGRLTAAELADTLRISRAAVSGGVRYLTQLGLISRERDPGSRRDYYWMPDDIWNQVIRLRDQVMLRWADISREGAELLGPDTPAGARLAEHAEFFDYIVKEIPGVTSRWEEHRATLPRPHRTE
jgi:DNA-binding transcriptional regulator GbsR (MarR family)